MANRFDQIIQPPRFSPLSFEEQSFAPLMLRGREDELMNNRDEILQQMNNIEVPGVFQEQVDKEREGLTNELGKLAERVQKEGAGNLNYLNDFRNLRNKYNKAVSATGNIGRAAGVKADIDTMRAAYLEDAINTKGQPAEIARMRFEEEKDKFIQGLPSDLSKFSGSLPQFTPAFAPNSVNMVDEVAKISKLASGINKDVRGTFHFEEGPNGELVSINTSTGKETNNPQIDALKKQLQSTLLDPNSDLNRNLIWRGIDPNDYISDIDNLTNMQRKISTATNQKGALVNQGAGGKGKTAKITPPGKASLSDSGAGRREIVNSFNTSTIKQALEDIKSDENISESVRSREITKLNHALQDKAELENNPEFRKTINPEIANNEFWQERGVNNYDEYITYIDSNKPELDAIRNNISQALVDPALKLTGINPNELINMQNLSDDELLNQFNNPGEGTIASKLFDEFTDYSFTGVPKMRDNIGLEVARVDRQGDKLKETYTELSNVLLEPSTFYSPGVEVDDTKFKETISKAIDNLDHVSLQNKGLFSIADEAGMFHVDDSTQQKPNSTTTGSAGEPYKNFNETLANATGTKWSFIGINDGGLSGSSQLAFNVSAKLEGAKDKNFTVAIDLDQDKLNSVTEQFLNPNGTYYKLLDKKSRRVLDGIRDKNRYGDTATDLGNIALGGEIFDRKGTENVQANSQQVLRDNNVSIRQHDNYVNSKLFFSPYDKISEMAVVINEDDSYSSYKRDAEGNTSVFTFGDMAIKDAAIQAHKEGRIAEMEKDESSWEEWGKASTIYNLIEVAGNLEELEHSAATYSLDPAYLVGLREADKIIAGRDTKALDKDLASRQRLAEIFDLHINNLTVYSKLFKTIL